MFGGLKFVLENIKVKNLVVAKQKEQYENYKEIIQIAISKKVNIITVKAGDRVELDKACYIDVLYPEANLSLSDINNNSEVLKFVYKGTKILFTGDIEEPAEAEILKMYDKSALKCDILKVAHHGSKTSTTDAFLEAVDPKIALIGVRKK